MSWILAFFGFVALIILHEFGHFIAAKKTGMRVERFSLFFPPLIVRKRVGETEYAIGATPLGGYVKITGMNPEEEFPPDVAPRAYYHQPVWKRILVILAGPAMNLLIAFLILFALAFGAAKAAPYVLDVGKDDPADGVLQKGDRIVSIDGRRGNPHDAIAQLDTFRAAIRRHTCPGLLTDGCRAATPAIFKIRRDGRILTIPIRPEYTTQTDPGRMVVGVSFGKPRHPDVPAAAGLAVSNMWYVTSATIGVIARIFNAQERKQLSGVVGSYEVTRQSFATDLRLAVGVLAIISLSLAIINLFPFLPLDGGHVFWSLVEKVRGKAVPYRVMEQAGVLGFMLVIFLFFIGLSNDIGRLTGGGFDTR
jgi:regulator of sigma E protease